MKILVITPEYYPEQFANALCLRNILEAMQKMHNVSFDVLTISHNKELSKNETIGGTDITRIESKYIDLVYNRERIRSSVIKIIVCLIRKICSLLIWPSARIVVLKKMFREAQKMLLNREYGAVITSSGDFVSQIVGNKLNKQFHVLWFPILLDPLPSIHPWYNPFIRFVWSIRKQESNMFINSTNCFIEEHLQTIALGQEVIERTNIVRVGIPNLQDYDMVTSDGKKIDKNEFITIVYAGVWKNDIRNPDPCVEIFREISHEIKIKLIVYTNEKYVSNDLIYFRECIPHEELIKIMIDCDFLLNIGNNIGLFPSKLVDYCSTGKPIINCVKNEEDVTLDFISHYPNGFVICENTFNETKKQKLVSFLKEKHERMKYNSISMCFEKYTPSYIGKKILERVMQVNVER